MNVTFFEKKALVTSEVKCCFSDIFILFNRVRQALQEYEYQKKNSDRISNTKLGENQTN